MRLAPCCGMRITLALIASGLVALGLWLIATGFMPAEAGAVNSNAQMSAAPAPTAGPVALGVALLAGGGLFFVLLLRRR